MKIQVIRAIAGPNVFHAKPVMLMKVDLQSWAEKGSHEIPGFTEKLIDLLPQVTEHTCSPGYPGGFIERLKRGTYMAHIIEHVALELSNLSGMQVFFGKTKYAGQPGLYDVVIRYLNEEAARLCLSSAVELVTSILEGSSFDVQSCTERIHKIHSETKLGPSAQALMDAALKKGIPCRRIGKGSLLQLGYGKFRRRVQTAVTDRTNLIACDIAQDKEFTKYLLQEAGVPVPQGHVVSTEEELLEVTSEMTVPLYAVKPLDGHHGNGVALNLKSREDLFKAFYIAKEYGSSVLVEEMCQGRDYRVLVIGGKFTAAAERNPPRVVGDGEKSIQALIEEMNQDPLRAEGHSGFLTQIEVDEILLETLKKQELLLTSVPESGREVLLRANANLSSGGTAKDVTDQVHPEVRALCERIARIIDLDICGIDLIAHDLSAPIQSSLKVIEVNAGPGLRMHLSPTEGKPRKVGEEIIDMIYPPGTPSRIPIAAVTGTNGKTTTVRLIHKILSTHSTVGLTTSDGVFVGSDKISSGDTTGPLSAQMVLSDPACEKVVLEVARGGILRRGLAYDWSDVGVITNIRPDHIGQDGIEDLEDLVWIKSLVAERVKENGILVLNADDEQSLALKTSERILKIPRKFVLYSTHSLNPALKDHLLAGGDAAWCEEGWLFLQMDGQVHQLVSTESLPFTFQGRAQFQVSNALAAVCASAAMGATPEQIVMGLMSFDSSLENRGRLNLYRVGEGHVILDYGHNPDAISAMGELLSQWKGYRRTAVFGLPGDRSDELIYMSAERMAQSFDRLIVRDDSDLRGRKPSEVPDLVESFVKSHFPKVECHKAHNEKEAVESIMTELRSDDIVVVFYDCFERTMPILRQYDPVPVSMIPFPSENPAKEAGDSEIHISPPNPATFNHLRNGL